IMDTLLSNELSTAGHHKTPMRNMYDNYVHHNLVRVRSVTPSFDSDTIPLTFNRDAIIKMKGELVSTIGKFSDMNIIRDKYQPTVVLPEWAPELTIGVRRQATSELSKRINTTKVLTQASHKPTGQDARYLKPYQLFVQNILSEYSPARGSVLMHQTGSGKTLTILALMESMNSTRSGVIISPASLAGVFTTEIQQYGHYLYSAVNTKRWIRLSAKDGDDKRLKLLVHADMITALRAGGNVNHVWWPLDANSKEGTPFEDLDTLDQKRVKRQVMNIISNRYTFLSYNGNITRTLDRISDNDTKNPFDGKILVVDEAHRFSIGLVGSEARTQETVVRRIYRYILTAKNAKVIMATATPIINHPVELSYLVNAVAGLRTEYVLNYILLKDLTELDIKKILAKFSRIETFTVDYAKNMISLFLTPSSFVRNSTGMLEYTRRAHPDKVVIDGIRGYLNRNGITIINNFNIEHTRVESAKRTFEEQFTGKFDAEKGTLDGGIKLLATRVYGYISYVGNEHIENTTGSNINPATTYAKEIPTEVIGLKMSKTQHAGYSTMLTAEQDFDKMVKTNTANKKSTSSNEPEISLFKTFTRIAGLMVVPPDFAAKVSDEEFAETKHELTEKKIVTKTQLDLTVKQRVMWYLFFKLSADERKQYLTQENGVLKK
ncbi:MAG: DEAD/DEAH box helicase family protein, partial [Methylococcales bacterium]|nr:DEAD/DEAH box helicase family protein [Methylococcales bacterium]